MATCLVTGCAGFLGSHLVERLLERGLDVVGMDCFTDAYPRSQKESNLLPARASHRFTFIEQDVASADLSPAVDVDYVFHLAAQPGVRASWGRDFETYVRHNVVALQRLLEACAGRPRLRRFVFASSSSVYGEADRLPTPEDTVPRPVSPYGVTKVAGEHLCGAYLRSSRVPTVSLRYFSLYGPRQRPDMAFHIFIRRALRGETIPVFGGGRQTRDFTFVLDAVEATIAAAERAGLVGETFNIGGGSRVTLSDAIDTLEGVMGVRIERDVRDARKGDPADTGADLAKSRAMLGFSPGVPLEEGLRREYEWLRAEIGSGG